MGTMASQISSLIIVYSTVYSGAEQRKHQSASSVAFGNSPVTDEFPAQMVSKEENVSIWWRHHEDVSSTLQARQSVFVVLYLLQIETAYHTLY